MANSNSKRSKVTSLTAVVQVPVYKLAIRPTEHNSISDADNFFATVAAHNGQDSAIRADCEDCRSILQWAADCNAHRVKASSIIGQQSFLVLQLEIFFAKMENLALFYGVFDDLYDYEA